MQEKKTSTGVVRVRLNVWTIIVLIILPFLLFILYAILFSECSDLLKKSGLCRSVENSGDELKENVPNSGRIEENNTGIFDNKNISSKPGENINESTEPKITLVLRIINLLFLLPTSKEGEKREEVNKNDYKIIKPFQKDDSKTEDKLLTEEKITRPKEDISKKDSSTQTDENKGEVSFLNNPDEYNTFFGPLVSYNYDSWDFGIPNILTCPDNGKDLYLLILIHSRVNHFEQRQAIRETWGRIAKMDGISYAFVLAIAADSHLDNKLKHESDEYKDIILTDLADLETNDTALSVMSFKWIMYYCSHVKYVFKTNDDVFVNLPQLALFLKEEKTKDDRMYGFLFEGYKPERNPKKDYYVTKREFDGDIYPNYLGPEGYIFPGNISPKLFKAAINMRYMPLESVFVTGILAEKLNITREDIPLFSSTFPDLPKTEKCNILFYTFVFHPLSPNGLRHFWNNLKQTGFKCANFLEKVGKMIPKDKRMYSDNNEKLLYALLAGEDAGSLRKDEKELQHSSSDEATQNSKSQQKKNIDEIPSKTSTANKGTENSEGHENKANDDEKIDQQSSSGKGTDNSLSQQNKTNDEAAVTRTTPTETAKGSEGHENKGKEDKELSHKSSASEGKETSENQPKKNNGETDKSKHTSSEGAKDSEGHENEKKVYI